MSRRRLTNDDWGLDSNCFVCEQRNRAGLQLEMWADDTDRTVFTEFSLDSSYSGAPTLVHGGLSLAILDEVQAWAVIAIEEQWAVTVETSARFNRGVRIDTPYVAVATIMSRDGDLVHTAGRIETPKGLVCVESTATFRVLGEAAAARVSGAEVSDANRRYTASISSEIDEADTSA